MNPKLNRLRLAVLGLAGALLLGSGCAALPVDAGGVSPETGQATPVDSSEFWSGLQVGGLEYDPPESLAELVDRSDYVFTGKVLGAEMGPLDESENGSGETSQLVALKVRANSVLKGDLADKDVKVAMIPMIPPDLMVKEKPSNNQAMLFLVLRPDGYYACSAMAGLVEDTPDGLITVADPGQSSLVDSGEGSERRTFDVLVERVRELVK